MLQGHKRITSSLARRLNVNAKRKTIDHAASAFSTETSSLPTRHDMIKRLQKGNEYDILVIGGGATGSGVALDAAARGLKVACVEKEDFASGTSSRSTKLIWGGSRYLVQALVALFSFDLRLLTSPVATVKKFISEFRMVLNCHRERKFLLEQQNHLTHWVPIAVPLTKWFLWPAPFNYPLAALGPLGLFPLFFKFYDSLSGFSAPPAHIMTKQRALRKFPQLETQNLKYCSVFYEGMHDDARTNLAIAQTAALQGADIVNYCEVLSFLTDTNNENTKNENPKNEKNENKHRLVGAVLRDTLTQETFSVRAKSVLVCGGPFTDAIRQLEDVRAPEAVTGASGVHIVLPPYFAPRSLGLVDMNTSDGRFLFMLPWQHHVLVGTTDRKVRPSDRPRPVESEIQWLLQEATKYISPDLKLRRKDVLSAWCGIRPLATDPHEHEHGNENPKNGNSNTAAASRDHVISHNPKTGMVFVAGGKWTTYREMAEDAVDKILETHPTINAKKRCETLTLPLIGHRGYDQHLDIRLVQTYGIPSDIAGRLARTYGGRAVDVLRLAEELHILDKRLLPDFPVLEAEVFFGVRNDWCQTAEDFLCRRTRLAFVRKEAALRALPRVLDIMAGECLWTSSDIQVRTKSCLDYLQQFGGPTPMSDASTSLVRSATFSDIQEAFDKVDTGKQGLVSRVEVPLIAELLRCPMSDQELDSLLTFAHQTYHTPIGHVSLSALFVWWNSEQCNPGLVAMKREVMAKVDEVTGSGTMFG